MNKQVDYFDIRLCPFKCGWKTWWCSCNYWQCDIAVVLHHYFWIFSHINILSFRLIWFRFVFLHKKILDIKSNEKVVLMIVFCFFHSFFSFLLTSSVLIYEKHNVTSVYDMNNYQFWDKDTFIQSLWFSPFPLISIKASSQGFLHRVERG